MMHARRMGRGGLQWACLIVSTGLVIQLVLGMILNLYIAIPSADTGASYLHEVETAPGMLTAHALVAVALLAATGFLLLRAIALRDKAVITLVVVQLVALLGAFAAGELFVRNGQPSASLAMAILTGAALMCSIVLQARHRSPVTGSVSRRQRAGRTRPVS